jgi:hypothetical protein
MRDMSLASDLLIFFVPSRKLMMRRMLESSMHSASGSTKHGSPT